MRVLIDDINHTVTTYEIVDVKGTAAEVASTYVSRQPYTHFDDNEIVIKGHPRVGAVIKAKIGGKEYRAMLEDEYGAQDMLAMIGSQVELDDTPGKAELGSGIDDEYVLKVSGQAIEHVDFVNFEHDAMPDSVKNILNRHMVGYKHEG